MCELDDDLCLILVKLNNIDVILDDAINVVRYEIYGKKKERAQKWLMQIKIKTLMDM